MTKPNSLQAALDAAKGNKDTTPLKGKKRNKVIKNSPKPSASRQGKVLIAGHFSKDVSKQLKYIGIEEEKTNQELLEEALDLLFVKKGKKSLSDI